MGIRALSSRLPSLLAALVLLPLTPAVKAQDTSEKTVSQPQTAAAPAKPAAKNKATSAAAKASMNATPAFMNGDIGSRLRPSRTS